MGRRVSVVVELAQPDRDRAIVLARLADIGLAVGGAGDEGDLVVVDVLVEHVSKSQARSAGVAMVEQALRHVADASVVEAARIDPDPLDRTWFAVDWSPPGRFAVFWRALSRVGLGSVGHTIAIPSQGASEVKARQALEQSPIAESSGWRLGRGSLSVRRMLGPKKTSPPKSLAVGPGRQVQQAVAAVVFGVLPLLVVVALGWLVSWRQPSGWWSWGSWAAALVVGVIVLAPLTDSAARGRRRHAVPARALLAAELLAFGVIFQQSQPQGVPTARILVTVGASVLVAGVLHLGGTWWGGDWWQAWAAVAALIAAGVAALRTVVDVLWAVYAEEFGVPAGLLVQSLTTDILMGATPFGLMLLVLALLLGLAGWFRFFRLSAGLPPALVVVMSLLLMALYALTIVGEEMDTVVAAHRKAVDVAADRRQPASFKGVQVLRVCVHPLAKQPAVHNGPLDVRRPLLLVPTSDDRYWLQAPGDRSSPTPSIPRSQASITVAKDGQRTCKADPARALLTAET